MNEIRSLDQMSNHENFLLECDIELTHDCNQSCRHCYLECPHKDVYADSEMIDQIFSELIELGCVRIGFTGGEPLLHPEFWSLLTDARKKRFAVDICTNGTLLDQAAVNRLAEAHVKTIRIGLLGASPETHDAIVKRPGAFRQATAGVRMLVDAGIRAELGCTILRENCQEVGDIRKLAADLGVRVAFDPLPAPSVHGRFDPRRNSASLEDMYEFAIPYLPKSERHSCGAGKQYLAITPFGDVIPCLMMRKSVGNLSSGSLKELWGRAGMLSRALAREDLVSYSCGSCKINALCRSCAGMTWLWQNTGLLDKSDVDETMKTAASYWTKCSMNKPDKVLCSSELQGALLQE